MHFFDRHVHHPLTARFLVVLSFMAVVACSDTRSDNAGNDAGTDARPAPRPDAATDERLAESDARSDNAGNDAGPDPRPDAATNGHLAEQVVGAAGGTVIANNGVSIEIPEAWIKAADT